MRKPSRPTMTDVAREAGVGVATVDRVLNRRAHVQADTARKVLAAAELIGFHATTLLRQRVDHAGDERTLGFLLQKSAQHFYQTLGSALSQATREATAIRGKPIVQFLENLTPAHVARAIDDLAGKADALAVVAAEHPSVSAAVERASAGGIPVFTLLSDLTTPMRAGFMGIDHRKAGRSAAWAVSRLAGQPGAIAIFVGSHRYLGHELCEISFRSYIREHASRFTVLEPLASFEEPQFAREAAHELLKRNSNLAGIYVAGGGIEGVIEALREAGRNRRPIVVCNEIVPETRAALIEGIVDLVISTPTADLARFAVAGMIAALKHQPARSMILPFQLFTSENL